MLPQDNAPDFQLHFVEDFVYDTVLHSIPSPGPPKKEVELVVFFLDLNEYPKCDLGGGFKRYLMFTSTWGNDPI